MCGRTETKTKGAPFLEGDMADIDKLKQEKTQLQLKLAGTKTQDEFREIRKQVRNCSQRLQRMKAKARGRFLNKTCEELDTAMLQHDMAAFYKGLQKLGIH